MSISSRNRLITICLSLLTLVVILPILAFITLELLFRARECQRSRDVSITNLQPRYVHISYGNSSFDIVVTWSTLEKVSEPYVEFGEDRQNLKRSIANVTKFVDSGPKKVVQYIHRALLKDLQPSTDYYYHCGSDEGLSNIFMFKTIHEGVDWSPRVALFGDLGSQGSKIISPLQKEVNAQHYDAVIHLGDFAYELNDCDGSVGDDFMSIIQPLAAFVPYMTCPGNHEQYHNFSHYKNRFSMPGPFDSMMYTWNLGPIQFVSFSTENYYFLKYGVDPLITQYNWLVSVLREANQPENRRLRPWVITYGHRPMYCSNNNIDDCTDINSKVRVGVPLDGQLLYGLESLFQQYRVDICLWGHEHSYERTFPMYNYTRQNVSSEHPYKNSNGLIHLIAGAAGNKWGQDGFKAVQPEFSAFRSLDYGYGSLKVINRTHILYEQISVGSTTDPMEPHGTNIIDSIMVVKDHDDRKIE